MVTLCSGMKNAFLVLEWLRNNEDLKDIDIVVYAMQNCREQGLSFVVYNSKHESFTFCVYEHRNSDQIILNGNAGHLTTNSDLPYKGDKWEYIADFGYGEHFKCAERLAQEIKAFANSVVANT